MDTVSVIIPSYNSAPYLEQAIRSAQAQTLRPLEILVVDDGSTDGSIELARKLGATALCTGSNAGPATARNAGIAAARGDLIAFLDADDYWEPAHCEGLHTLLAKYPQAAVAYSQAQEFGARNWLRGVNGIEPARNILLDLLAENLVVQSSALVRRDALCAAGGYQDGERLAEDYDLWLRLARHYPFVATSAATTMYRVHAAQASRSTGALHLAAWEARLRLWNTVITEGPAERRAEVEAALIRAWDQNLRVAWVKRKSTALAAVLGLHQRIPGSRAVYRKWWIRAHVLRGPWTIAAAAWDALPAGVRTAIRSVKPSENLS